MELRPVGIPIDYKAQTITVAKLGGDFTSIKDACDSISDSAIDKRYIISAYPGDYTEAPFTIPTYVSAVGVDKHPIRLFPSDNNTDFVNLSANAEINEFIITAPTNAAGIRVNNVGGALVDDCDINGGLYGLRVSGSSGRCTVNRLDTTGNDRNLFAETSSRITVLSVRSTGGAYGAYADNATIDIRDAIIILCSAAGALATGGGRITANMASIIVCSYGVRVEANSELDASNLRFGTITNDEVSQDDDTARIEITSGRYNSEKRQITNWDNVELDGFDIFPGNKGYEIVNELHVGVPEAGRESCVGEGDSYTRGMLVYTYDGVDYADVSTAAASSAGSTFTFPNTDVDTAIYVASSLAHGDKIQHLGIKQAISAAVTLGGGEIIAEYYNGAWIEFSIMSSESTADYFPLDGSLFAVVGDIHTRYSCKIPTDWAKFDPMTLNTDYYWVRFRIKTTITTAPTFEQWRLHSNHTEMNPDGWIEYFGTARPIGRLPWGVELLKPINTDSPANQDLFLSDHLGLGRAENKFQNNATDRTALATYLPFDYDTSCPLRIVLTYITDDATAGNIRWVIRWAYSQDGNNIYRSSAGAPTAHSTEQSIIEIVTAPTAADTQGSAVIQLDTSKLVSRRSGTPNYGDILWVSIEREGPHADDTHEGDVAIIQLTANYTQWCEGGHA